MKKKNYVNKKIFSTFKHICLLLSILAVLILWGCGYQKESKTSDISPHETSIEANNEVINDINNNDVTDIEEDLNSYNFVLSFAGDINFDENWSTMEYYNTVENGIYDCFSPELIQMMRDADIMCLNNEFTYSTNGTPLEGKYYTFRAHPSRVNILKELGVDIVSLANNHVYDYGVQSLIDTMATLKQADILYYGAGHNLDEAMSPVYFEIQGKTIAYVAASRAEKYKMTPQATEDSPGILRCYDTELFIQTIKEAKENADYVIAYVHWGTENTYELEEVQLTTGKEYLDAGADIVIGAHPHCLQGIEYYNGKPIVYSLGNFWFNDRTIDTMLLNIHFYGDDTEEFIELEIVPAIQENHVTRIVTEQSEKERIFSFLEDISINVEIDEEGIISEVSN
ncbi:PGA biosynthesis protein capA [Proteiniborus sp. DW1]|uniref:CapA family protein n=1 Tax=Proteiniborus sp. DW1 TaxID=1889883 RepID=UPI00092E1891|nr:CapA family protein [Proteiniborus sp. DW1]SCG82371.1 PGA biosynthesis protein capA [Proteiniborus sp. DW1]